ncbi:MAG: AEC family transporter [Candidatus Fermentibacteraceae bacterium]
MFSAEYLAGLASSLDIIVQMAILVLLGYLMTRRGWISPGTLSDLTRVLIDLVLPCTFILAMARAFTPEFFGSGAVLAAVSAGWVVAAWLFGTVWFRLLPSGHPSRDRSVTAMMMVSNSLYLPLPVMLAVTPTALHDRAVVYISMVAVPSIIANWTVGVALLSGTGPSARERLKLLLNAPILSLFAGILLSFIPGVREAARGEPGAFVPARALFSVMEYLGRILSPLAMIILGGMIASGRGAGRARLRFSVPLIAVRLVLIPGAVYLLVTRINTGLPPLALTALLLAAAAPPATNHALIARRYNGEWELVSKLQLAVHAAALLTLPLWLSLGLGL